MGRVTGRAIAVVVGLALSVTACTSSAGEPDASVRSTEDSPGGDASTPSGDGEGGQMRPGDLDVDEPIRPTDDITVMGGAGGPNSADDVMLAAAVSVQEFWVRAFPDTYGTDFEEVDGGFWTYGPDTPRGSLPPCEGIQSYDDVAQNAFYCPDGDLIAWDSEVLVAPHIDEFGEFGAAIIMAHEMGHAVQARTGDFDTLPGVIAELQADCFAGAWIADVVAGGSDDFEADIEELDLAVAGQISIRDDPGFDPDDPAAHGSGFDRVSGLADGIFEGTDRCAGYAEEPPVVTEAAFDPEDAASGGDLSPDDLLELLLPDLEDFYTALFASEGQEWDPVDDVIFFDPSTDDVRCGSSRLTEAEAEFAIFYCGADDTVQVDGAGLVPALQEIGDFAVGAEVARQWAFAAQARNGLTENSRESSLNADCLTGLYAGDLFLGSDLREGGVLSLSPGDLDEAIISFLAVDGDDEQSGSAFERSDAFRIGFLGDLAQCDALLE